LKLIPKGFDGTLRRRGFLVQRFVTNFFDHTLDSLGQYLVDQGLQKFRAQQLFRWVYQRGVTDFSQMTDMSKELRSRLPELLHFTVPPIVKRWQSLDGTEKFLFDVSDGKGDGKTIEGVIIPSEGRRTLCVSSEVGCNMACKFCFTAKQKLQRRLRVSEIVGQLYGITRLATSEADRVSNIVFMGMGEPLDNVENVFPAIEIFHEALAFNIGLKKITVSTSGLVPQIPLVTQSGARLAVSLNGVNDEVRTQIMPINKRWPIKELLEACEVHCRETNDKVTFEYVLLKGVTDSLEDARALHRLTRRIPCKINIIPFNEHPDSGFHRPAESQIRAFQDELMNLGSHVLRRKTMGRDIFAACGQLTSAYKGRPEFLGVSS
jgi:23S rRNA (adenine2503-C2)-methyltransferase